MMGLVSEGRSTQRGGAENAEKRGEEQRRKMFIQQTVGVAEIL